MRSIEEKVEEQYKSLLDSINVRHYGKTEEINSGISDALRNATSKSGGSGNNYPDIQILLQDEQMRRIPVMIEAKGSKNKLLKLDKDNNIVGAIQYEKNQYNRKGDLVHEKGDYNYSAIKDYAVNGAVHYGNAILDGGEYDEVIVVGVNGTELNVDGSVKDPECKAYYISEKNKRIPKLIDKITERDWSLFKNSNVKQLYKQIDKLNLTEEEINSITKKLEGDFENSIKDIHQLIFDDVKLKSALGTNDKMHLFCGLIMAGLKSSSVAPLDVSDFKGNDNEKNNDGTIILNNVSSFLCNKNCESEKVDMILNLLSPVFTNKVLWTPTNGESKLKKLFKHVKQEIIPYLESDLHLDFTGIIFNRLSDWVSIDNDIKNDVVLTPRYITTFMAKLARTNKDSIVWDNAMGSAGFLVSAMDIMIRNAVDKIADADELENKIKSIKEKQLLGIEILPNIYILAVLNMILMGDGSSNILNGDSHAYKLPKEFSANVFLLNPPYSASGKGFVFVEEALSQMLDGYACVLIQDSAGNGQGLPYTRNILKRNTLEASIKMPAGLFGTKASVSVYIFVFKVNRPHEKDDLVTFVDFSNDGYSRQNKKKAKQDVNLKDTDNAKERYEEVEAIILGKKAKTAYYTEENGLLIRETISIEGNDWLFTQHQKIDMMPNEEDFKTTVADYLSWKISNLMKGVE